MAITYSPSRQGSISLASPMDEVYARAERARQEGFSEEEIAYYSSLDSARIQAQLSERTPQEQPKKTSGRGGFLSSLISEIGGMGGAGAGAMAGAPLGPIGVLGGAAIGGLLGGFSGRAVENKVRDDEFRVGDATKEGLLMGALSAVGPGYRMVKGGMAAKGAMKGVAGQAGRKELPGLIEGGGQGLRRSVSGYGIGTKVSGERELTARASDEFADIAKEFRLPNASPEQQARAISTRLADLETKLGEHYAKNNARFGAGEIKTLKESVRKAVKTQPGLELSKTNLKYLESELARLGNQKNPIGLWNYSKSLTRKGINFDANPSAKLVDREAINRAIRDSVKNFQNKKIGGLKETNNLYYQGSKLERYLTTSSKPSDGGYAARFLELAPIKGAGVRIGAAVENIGRATAGTAKGKFTGPASQFSRMAKLQAPLHVKNAFFPQQAGGQDLLEAPATEDQDLMELALASELGGGDPYSMGADSDPFALDEADTGAPEDFNSYPLEAAIADMQRDPKNADYYQQIYAMAAKDFQDRYDRRKEEAKASNGLNITKVTAQQYGLAERGYTALQELKGLLQRDPQVLERARTPGRSVGLFGIGGSIARTSGTEEFDALTYSVASALLRLETGAQANDSEIRNLQSQLIPRSGSSPKGLAVKFAELERAFSAVLERAQSGGTSGLDAATLEEAIDSYGGM